MDCHLFKPSSELIHIFYNQYIFSDPNGVDVPLYIVLYLVFIMSFYYVTKSFAAALTDL